ncbi:transglycosylase domain-containing protein [Fictibacillus barbaricus]|uniref:PBP1A family penicillin-binding protein n=1 Tax=Fictibacillus barbaricus TaxID=182136 RepID=A0ABS2ZA74_9BACL|nr:PBP1A family penicillin-binding protein [Fictibacillus barbaricus]MBN3544557.1 PBP1A family penicillin-binding protein [Fictibacillus barbaricus]GGB65772.1 penicillin-binding protein 1F [Fictibacillus barbaricus]
MIKKSLIVLGILTGSLIIGFFAYLFIIMAGDYVIDEKDLVMDSATLLVTENGDKITKIYDENRDIVGIEDIPAHVQEAFVAVEDSRFYKHSGIDVKAISRAIYKDILAGSKVEGGSTITQQLAKNVFLSHEKSWLRKTKEAVIAINLERRYSKDKILEMYLNQIYFGHGAYGIQLAAKTYFNKDVKELTVAEGAMLAGLPKAPNYYSPIKHPEAAKERRDLVLTLMEKQDYLSPAETVRAQGMMIALDFQQEERNPAYTTYIDMVIKEAKEKYHLSREELRQGGYKIVVPMDPAAQDAVYKSFQDGRYFVGTGQAKPEGAMVLMDSKSGGLLAVQGGRNYVTEGLNRVEVKRQPGSTFKPLSVYGPALESEKYKPYSMLRDEELSYNGYEPKNYNGKYEEKVPMVDAISRSVNSSAVWLLNEIGISDSKKYLEELGMPIEDKGLGIALGGIDHGVSPLQMVQGYRSFLHEGKTVEPYVISKIYNNEGDLVGKAKREEKKVWKKQNAWYMTRMLQQVIKNGTGSDGAENMEIAGKTGTTNFPNVDKGNKDTWFVGFTPEVVGAVWVGYDRTTKESYLNSGSAQPTLLFKQVINGMPSQQGLKFKKPDGVKDLEPPIELIEIADLGASFGVGDYGMPSVQLNWSPSKDKRLQYKVYAVNEGETQLLDTVKGKGQYMASGKNLFTLPDFYVVPYNPLTKQEGQPSNVVSISLFPSFGDDEKEGKEKGRSGSGKEKKDKKKRDEE